MPNYKYHCNHCGNEFVTTRAVKDRATTQCEACGDVAILVFEHSAARNIFIPSCFTTSTFSDIAPQTDEEKAAWRDHAVKA